MRLAEMVARVKTAMAGPLPAAVAKMKLYMVGFWHEHTKRRSGCPTPVDVHRHAGLTAACLQACLQSV